jgi:hypothetical protein
MQHIGRAADSMSAAVSGPRRLEVLCGDGRNEIVERLLGFGQPAEWKGTYYGRARNAAARFGSGDRNAHPGVGGTTKVFPFREPFANPVGHNVVVFEHILSLLLS